MPFEFRAGESFGDATLRIVREQLNGALESLVNEASSLDERVHSVRKNFKRVRAMLRLLRHVISDSIYEAENEAFRDAGQRLSDVRDANVLIKALEALRLESGKEHKAAFAYAKELLLARHAVVQRNMLDEGDALAATSRDVKRALDRLENWNHVSNSPKKVTKGLRAVYRSGRNAFRRVNKNPSVQNLHEWRKRVKHLRHGLELLTPVRPKAFAPLVHEAEELGGLLGRDHDLALLQSTLPPEGGDVVTGFLKRLVEAQRKQLQGEIMVRGGVLYRNSAREFVRGLKSRLRTWRHATTALI